ncbi:MAG: FAD-binding oxidoreductase [Myxococcales bacterium]|nr:FAD-binding oxidoreductase [Myxococcales bacterium]
MVDSSSMARGVPSQWKEALSAWRDALGAEKVQVDGEGIEAAQVATFPTTQQIWAVLFPSSREEVQACMQIASRFQIPIYPTSCGKNWGLGSRVPTEDAVLMDLSRMDRILDFDEDMAYVTVEPGVTFQQVFTFLKEQGSSLMLSVIGGSPYASVIGNCAERGDGVGPYGERPDHLCDMEVVLPDGEVLYTGFSRYATGGALAPLSRWAPGPGLSELFFQSSLGVITRLTIWLMPKPAYLQVVWATFRDAEQLAQSASVFRKLTLQGTIPRNTLALWNLYKVLARKQQYPWDTHADGKPLLMSDFAPLEPWYACAALYHPSREHARVEKRYLLDHLEHHVHDLMFFDQDGHAELSSDNLFLGAPTQENIFSTYWRKSSGPPEQMDPDRDRCGVLWMCHVIPFHTQAMSQFVQMTEQIVLEHGLEPNLGIACMSPRAARVFVALMYDREQDGADERAIRCHDAVFAALCDAGFLPYRLGLPSMLSMPPATDASSRFLAKVKELLDPARSLAPGRYEMP